MQPGQTLTDPANPIVLLVGTTKGVFTFWSDATRRAWRLAGPYLGGWEVYSVLGDSRGGRNRLFAGTHHKSGGPTVQVSDDLGASWRPVESGPRFAPTGEFDWDNRVWIPKDPAASGPQREWSITRIWQLALGHLSQPDTLYAGTEEAALFVSRDAGENWEEVSGLTRHPTRPYWGPGAGGMGLHTILVHPTNTQRMWWRCPRWVCSEPTMAAARGNWPTRACAASRWMACPTR